MPELEEAIQNAYNRPFNITREIGIDMGHRVTLHGSKCKNLHGHRYTIQATLSGMLIVGGEQDGMVMDFGFLKDVMMQEVDAYFDHGTCLWVKDPLCRLFFGAGYGRVREIVELDGYAGGVTNEHVGKVYVLSTTPTAENLAAHWHWRINKKLKKMKNDGLLPRNTLLSKLTVWETPNCFVEFYG